MAWFTDYEDPFKLLAYYKWRMKIKTRNTSLTKKIHLSAILFKLRVGFLDYIQDVASL